MSKTPKAELRKFTFPVSGKEVYLRKVSVAAIGMALRKKYKKPEPPLQDVDYGNGHKVKERNYAHPDYALSMQKWTEYVAEAAVEVALKKALHIHMDEAKAAEVAAFRAEFPELVDVGADDRDVWLENIAIVDDEDLTALIGEITGYGEPTEEAVQSTVDNF